MSVLIDNRQNFIPVDEKLEAFTEDVVNAVLNHESCMNEYEVSISFVGNEEIKSLNVLYRNIDSETDVLSFPMLDFDESLEEECIEDEDAGEECLENGDDDGEFTEMEAFEDSELALGDIVISMEKAKEQAQEYGHSFDRELAFLLVHGMLHLLGWDHETEDEEKDMFDRQEKILRIINLQRS